MKQFDIGDILICLKPLQDRESIPYFSEAKKVYSNYNENESNKWVVTNISTTYYPKYRKWENYTNRTPYTKRTLYKNIRVARLSI